LCFHKNQNAVGVGVVLVKNLRQKNVRFWPMQKKSNSTCKSAQKTPIPDNYINFQRLTSNPTFVVRCFVSPTKPHSKKSNINSFALEESECFYLN
jgi:hypothetical protein